MYLAHSVGHKDISSHVARISSLISSCSVVGKFLSVILIFQVSSCFCGNWLMLEYIYIV